MKLRNLILLPATALTTAVRALTMTSCNKGQDPEPDPEPVTPDFGEFEISIEEIGPGFEWPVMKAKNKVSLKKYTEYTFSLTSKIEFDDEFKDEMFPIDLFIYTGGSLEAENYLLVKDFKSISCYVDNEQIELDSSLESVPMFYRDVDENIGFTYQELLNKTIKFKFVLNKDFDNADTLVTYFIS